MNLATKRKYIRKYIKFPTWYFKYCIILFITLSVSANVERVDWQKLSATQYEVQRTLCQIKLDKIKWQQQIWPAQNKHNKPKFENSVSVAALQAKVKNSLLMETVLAKQYQARISLSDLQNELNRMVANSKAPNQLKQFFAALDNDANSIAECLIRPLLVEKMLYQKYSNDPYIHNALQRQAQYSLTHPEFLVASGGKKYHQNFVTSLLKVKSTEFALDALELDDLEFKNLLNELQQQKSSTQLVETDTAFIHNKLLTGDSHRISLVKHVWQKRTMESWLQDFKMEMMEITAVSGSMKMPAFKINLHMLSGNSWSPIANGNPGRRHHTTVWTGAEMVIWAGLAGSTVNNATYSNSGSRYNPALDSWSFLSIANAPSVRSDASGIWTGTHVVVWGGVQVFTKYNTGGLLDPITGLWSPTQTIGAPSARYEHSAVWTDSEMIIWGGEVGGITNTGGKYNPSTNSWVATTTTGAPNNRKRHTGVWDGGQMIIWGGANNLITGGRYDPDSDSWTPTSTINVPEGREFHTAVWGNGEMIIWGGVKTSPTTDLNSGGRYNPTTDSWIATTLINAPSARRFHKSIWAQNEMIVWGDAGTTGGLYYPSLDSWLATSTTDAPAARNFHSQVWTGTQMLIWGGQNLISGAAFTPPPIPSTITLGGELTDLLGNQVVLQNNGTDNLSLTADGSFTFATAVDDGSNYEVTVFSQPMNPSQTCSVSNGSGTVSGNNITDVAVNCITNSFTVGGSVSGLQGNTVVLQNNAGDDLIISDNGVFNFSTPLQDLSNYSVTVLTHPTSPDLICLVDNGNGTLSGAPVTNISVNCQQPSYTIGGSVQGLAVGNSLVVQNNGVDDLAVTTNGAFSFATALTEGSNYSVSVLTQPTTPTQTCGISNGSGIVGMTNIDNVLVNCNTEPLVVADVYSVNEDLVLVENGVLSNDSDSDMDLLTIVNPGVYTAGGIGGSISIEINGNIVYIPPEDAVGQATFNFEVTDGLHVVASALLIDVLEVNDPPTFSYQHFIDGFGQVNAQNTLLISNDFFSDLVIGPLSEVSQNIQQINFNVINDPDHVINSLLINLDGSLEVDFTLNTGFATVQFNIQDDGGTVNGGLDTSATLEFVVGFRILVFKSSFEVASLLKSYLQKLQTLASDEDYPVHNPFNQTLSFYGQQYPLELNNDNKMMLFAVQRWLTDTLILNAPEGDYDQDQLINALDPEPFDH